MDVVKLRLKLRELEKELENTGNATREVDVREKFMRIKDELKFMHYIELE